MLPRHLEIIFEINRRFLDAVRTRFPGDEGRVQRMSLVEEGAERKIRMANLAIVGSHSTNGVAAIHSGLLRTMTVKDLAEMFPERFNNKTNGVTPRRWLLLANPALAGAITEAIGDGWVTDLGQLRKLKPLADDKSLSRRVPQGQRTRPSRALPIGSNRRPARSSTRTASSTARSSASTNTSGSCSMRCASSCSTTGCGRIPASRCAPRTFFFAGKAAPAYQLAKLIIKFINNLAGTIDGDPVDARPAQGRVPARLLRFARRAADPRRRRLQPDLDRRLRGQRHEQHEVHDERGADDRHARRRDDRDGRRSRRGEFLPVRPDRANRWPSSRGWYNPHWHYDNEPETRAALDLIFSDHFSRYEPGIFAPLRDALLTHGDHYMHLADLKSYLEADQRLLRAVCRRRRVGAQGDLECGRLREVLQRPHDRPIRRRDLEGEALSGAIERIGAMTISPLAGKPAPKEMLVDLARLEREYFERRPDLDDPGQLVSFGTSGHRGSPLRGTFTEAHILAITQAICDYRRTHGHRRPALHGQGHARAFRAGPAHRARSPGGQRRGDHHPARRRGDADAGHLARHPRPQPRRAASIWPTASSSRPRTTRRRMAASNTTRPMAVRPTPT